MTTYLGEKAVGVGTIKTYVAVADVLHDNTLVGNGNTEPLGVNTENIVSQQTLANTVSILNNDIQKTFENSVKKSGDTITGILTIQAEEDYDPSTPPVGGLSFKSNASPVEFTNRMRQVGNGFIAIEYLLNGKQYSNLVFGDQEIYIDNTENGTGNPVSLGTSGNPWDNVYAKKLNNGANITIPTLGGTLARIEDIQNATTTLNAGIAGNAQAIQKTREDYIQADSEIHQMLNGLSAETTTIKNNQASLGTQVANIEHKIPDGTTGTNSLINKQILAQTSYTKAEVDAKVSSVYKFKGSVSTYNSLPSTATVGDVYNVTDTGANYAWDGSKWDKLSETIDLTAYATTEYVTAREQDIRSDLGENISEVHEQVVGLSGEVAKKLNSDGGTMTGTLNVPELNVATPEGTLNLSITAGVATIATNNGLDIVSQTKFDKAPTTDDNTTWDNALDTSLVRKAQVVAAIAQSGGGSGDSLPDQTGNAKKFLMTDGTNVSWQKAYRDQGTGTDSVIIGRFEINAEGGTAINSSGTVARRSVVVGYNSNSAEPYSVAIGYLCSVRGQYAIQLGRGINSDANTFKVGLSASNNYELLSADGTIPLERLTKVTDQIGDISTALTAILGE